jgi:hypothetical protein
MYDELESNDELERTDEDSMPDRLRCYETLDGFEVSLIRNPKSQNVLVRLWDNAEDAWKKQDEHLLATSGSWIPTESAGDTAAHMLEMRHLLRDIRASDSEQIASLPQSQ